MSNNIVNKMLDIFGLGDEEDSTYDGFNTNDEEEEFELINGKKPGKLVSIHQNSNTSVAILKPMGYEDITALCDCLKQKKIVIMNLKNIELSIAQRCVDFASGAICAIDGDIKEVSPDILLLTPNGVDVSSDLVEDLSRSNAFSWTGR